MISMLARNWWAFVARGILAILFGLIALFVPGVTMLSLFWSLPPMPSPMA